MGCISSNEEDLSLRFEFYGYLRRNQTPEVFENRQQDPAVPLAVIFLIPGCQSNISPAAYYSRTQLKSQGAI
jgi:hypothetical protein